MDVLVLDNHQQIVAAIEVQNIMKKIVVFARLASHECVQRVVEELVDVLVGVIKGNSAGAVVKTNRGANVGSPAPQITKEAIEFVRSTSQECVQRTVEQGVDVPVL